MVYKGKREEGTYDFPILLYTDLVCSRKPKQVADTPIIRKGKCKEQGEDKDAETGTLVGGVVVVVVGGGLTGAEVDLCTEVRRREAQQFDVY
jgi:hypothetical protein